MCTNQIPFVVRVLGLLANLAIVGSCSLWGEAPEETSAGPMIEVGGGTVRSASLGWSLRLPDGWSAKAITPTRTVLEHPASGARLELLGLPGESAREHLVSVLGSITGEEVVDEPQAAKLGPYAGEAVTVELRSRNVLGLAASRDAFTLVALCTAPLEVSVEEACTPALGNIVSDD